MEKLRIAYFSDKTSIDTIKRANLALMSDLAIIDSMLKAVALQANANNKNTDKIGSKNTFLYRFKCDIETQHFIK